MTKSNNNIKSRKGISTVVGSVFFIIVFTTATGYFLYTMNQLDKFGEVIIAKGQEERNVQQEEFGISSVTKDNNKFNITVDNTGQIPVNITRLWVQNRTDPSWGTFKFTINQIVPPGQSVSKIGQSLPLTALATQAYDLTVATDRGNTKEVLVNSASAKPIYLQLYVLPDTVPTKFTTTLLMAVTNNMSGNTALTNLSPNQTKITSYGATATLVSGPEPFQYPFLNTGDTAYFKWVYNITGSSGQKVNFQTSLKNGYLGNLVSKNVTVSAVQGSTMGFTSPANQTGTSSLGGVMTGLAVTFTPKVTGKVQIVMTGVLSQTTSVDGCKVELRQGTGAAPANGAAKSGTVFGSNVKAIFRGNNDFIPFSTTAQITGLTINTQIWVDLAQYAITGGTCSVKNVNVSIIEI